MQLPTLRKHGLIAFAHVPSQWRLLLNSSNNVHHSLHCNLHSTQNHVILRIPEPLLYFMLLLIHVKDDAVK